MAKEVSFIIKINDNGSAKRVTADAEELGRVIRSVQDESERLKSDILTWSQASQAIDVLQDSISDLQSVMQTLPQPTRCNSWQRPSWRPSCGNV